MTQYRISEAAELLGVSDDTVRRWVEAGSLAAGTDDGGRAVVEGGDLAAFAVARAHAPDDPAAGSSSARNRFTGLVTAITTDRVMARSSSSAGRSASSR